jgi:hypothetical protein
MAEAIREMRVIVQPLDDVVVSDAQGIRQPDKKNLPADLQERKKPSAGGD